MSDKIKCPACNQLTPKHFFFQDKCIPCATASGASAKIEASTDYEVQETTGCASGACTL